MTFDASDPIVVVDQDDGGLEVLLVELRPIDPPLASTVILSPS
jgi:hypothetical protein